jgi:cyclopropane fatty-acyl-phospholipid synthase-like methyltransferase
MKASTYHPEWQKNRVEMIIELMGESAIRGKRILELGAFNGWIGNYFAEEYGCRVTSVDGRQSNADVISQNCPLIDSVICADLDTPDWNFGKYDIIINFGLFYHLERHHREHLENCIDNCETMFFESVIYDCSDPIIHYISEHGIDQSLSDRGGNPTTSYVESIFADKKCKFVKYSSSRLNGGPHRYDWIDRNSKVHDIWARRFWMVTTPTP